MSELALASSAALEPLGHFYPERAARRDQNAAEVYLIRLDSATSRPTQTSAVRHVAQLLLAASGQAAATRGGREPWLWISWGDMRFQHVRKLMQALAERCGPATRRRYLSALKGIALEARRLKQMPIEDYMNIADERAPRGKRLPQGRLIARDDLGAMYAACDASDAGRRDRALLSVLHAGALRRSEAAALTVAAFNPDERSLRVIGKGDKERLVYLPSWAAHAFKRWIDRRPFSSQWVFHARTAEGAWQLERPLSPQGVLLVLRAIAKRAGTSEKFGAHDLRRTFITTMLEAGTDPLLVQKLAGHSNIATTTIYDMREERAKRDAVEQKLRIQLPADWWET